ncbi:MAG: hydroxymethylpyrimidine/phosphomethylpyrimidine kinase [Immundisolibacteraceae bacterium]|nr:hydroxymethylpyrimidine/phosphomethylpyrimidine kinase [Immundisolibacteraceae bacterium]
MENRLSSQINQPRPVVLCFSGHDPGGGAGIQADIEAIGAAGGHAATCITALTDQDSQRLYSYQSVDPALLKAQADHIIADFKPVVIKVGMVGSHAILAVIADIVRAYPDLALIIDPVLSTGGGAALSESDFVTQLAKQLIPVSTLVTPNSDELSRLCPGLDQAAGAARLIESGCSAVLVTGTHLDSDDVVNTLYRQGQPPLSKRWPRLSGEYHGSGCTLASYIAGVFAQTRNLEMAVLQGQQYTWDSLGMADRLGEGQSIPNRLIRVVK